jgi:hypothetical protein
MPTLFQGIQGFAGASGVGVLCLSGLFLAVSVFADNLPLVATNLLTSPNWSAVAAIPVLVVSYVVGLLAIALVEGTPRSPGLAAGALGIGAVAARYGQLEQEAEILSGSVVGFTLLGIAAFVNILVHSGWARTLSFSGALCLVVAASAWRMSRMKHAAAIALCGIGA